MRWTPAAAFLALSLSACDTPDAFFAKRELKVVLNGQALYIHPDNPIDIPEGNKVKIEKGQITITGADMITIRDKAVGVRGNTITIGASQFDASTFKKVKIDRVGNVYTDSRTDAR
ncbi:MAG: hypothetical protein AAB215_09420 [Planctomycetota bacterium]